jgi:uncharacterized GH25 family protein
MRRSTPAVVLALAGLAAAARAHDFWIEPSTFHPAPGGDVTVSLRVGQGFRGDPVPRNPALIQRFAQIGERGETPIDGLPGADPAGEFRVSGPGLVWIAYRSGRSPVSLEADKFEKYLVEEGLESVSALRRQRGESGKPGREVFSRSVKSLLVAEPAGAGAKGFDRALGLPLELVFRKDPFRAVPGKLPLSLLADGKPLSGALVVAMEQSAPESRVSGRTDAKGGVALDLSRKGIWLIKAVRMTPAPAGVDADWESVWTSLTFEVR